MSAIWKSDPKADRQETTTYRTFAKAPFILETQLSMSEQVFYPDIIDKGFIRI
jgi:hypothetical protein